MKFDWTFEFQKDGEIPIVDQGFSEAAKRSFIPRVKVLGFKLKEPILTSLGTIKIARIEIYDPNVREVVGVAIRLQDKSEIHSAMKIF